MSCVRGQVSCVAFHKSTVTYCLSCVMSHVLHWAILESKLLNLRPLSFYNFSLRIFCCDWSFWPRTFINGTKKTFFHATSGTTYNICATDIATNKLNQPRGWFSENWIMEGLKTRRRSPDATPSPLYIIVAFEPIIWF